MKFAPVTTIEVAMADDGTYRIQAFRYRAHPSATPDETVAGQKSIPEGLRALADELERAGEQRSAVIPEPYQLVMLALIAGRVWKLVGDDTITERPREWVLDQLEERRGSGEYWSQFITCPWCAGAWISLLTYVAWMGTLGQWPSNGEDVMVGAGVWLAISSLVGWYGHLLELGT